MAVRFDVATDRISLTAALPTTFTITGWIYLSVDRDDFATWCRLWDAGASTVATWSTDFDGTTGPGYFTGAGSITNATNLIVGEWRKVAITRTGSSGQSLVATVGGGTEVDSGTVGTGTPAGITLGGRGPADGNEWWNGRNAYFRVWSSVLTQAQIEAEWASAAPVITSGLWADWPLPTAADLTDHSGNGRDLVAGSTAVTTEDGPFPSGVATVGRAAAGAAATAQAVKSAAVRATATAGGSTAGAARKLARTSSTSTAGTAPTAGPRKRAITFVSVGGGAAGLSVPRKLARAIASAAAGALAASTAGRRAATSATSSAGAAARAAAVRRASASASVTAGAASTAVPRRRASVLALATGAAVGTAAARRLAAVAGRVFTGAFGRHSEPSVRVVYRRLHVGGAATDGELHVGPVRIR